MKFLNNRFILENKCLLVISAMSFLLAYISSFVKGYGYFIDEFYYIACAARPAAGYVDHPPLAPLVLSSFQFIFGSSLYAVRILPALALSATVFFTGIITKEIGGQKFAQCLAACAMAASPMAVAFAGFYSMNAFEPLIAIALIYFVIRMIKENNPRIWIWSGIVMGLGVMNKHTFGLFIIALTLSLLIAGKWRLVINKWFVLGGLIAFIIFLPNIIWQVLNNYPSLEFYRNISTSKNVYTPPAAFITGQIIGMSPSVLPVWFAGMVFLLLSKSQRDFRFLSVLFMMLFLFMMLTGTSRSDRMIFAYPAVFAGGALFFESLITKYNLRWFKGILIVFLFLGLALALPLILPYFSYDYVASYVKQIGYNTELERGNKPPLPQLLADRIGWEDKFKLVLNAYKSLPPEDQKEVVIGAGNYGQAGAIELFGKKFNLPTVATSQNSYYLWNKGRLQGSILLQLDNARALPNYKELFDSVEQYPGIFTSRYVTAHENNLVVFICRGPKISFNTMLDKSKFYY